MTLEEAMSKYRLCRNEAVIVCVLTNAHFPVVRMQTLRDEVEQVAGDRTTEEGIRSAIKRARPKLAGHAAIKAAWGVGYEIVWHKPDDRHAGKL